MVVINWAQQGAYSLPIIPNGRNNCFTGWSAHQNCPLCVVVAICQATIMQLRKRAEKQLVEPTLFKKGPRKFPHLAGIPDLLAGTYIGPFIPSHAQCCNRHFWLVVHKKNNSVLEIEENWLNFNLAAHSFPLLSAQEKSALDSFLANNKDLVLRHEAGVVTSTIESFHSACLKHFSKKVAVSSWSWELRVNMARLEWNHVPDWRKRVRKALLKRWKKRFWKKLILFVELSKRM